MENNKKQKNVGYFLLTFLFVVFTLLIICFQSLKPAFGFASLFCGLMLFNIIFTTLTNALIVRGESILPDGTVWRIILIIMTSVFFAVYCAL